MVHLIKKTMGKAGVQASDICAMGITTQRNTLILWDKCVPTFHDLQLRCFAHSPDSTRAQRDRRAALQFRHLAGHPNGQVLPPIERFSRLSR